MREAKITNKYGVPIKGISYFLFVLLAISVLSTNAFAQTNVKEISIYTDSSWKVFDKKIDGWTSIDFDDSYWLNAKETCEPRENWGKALCLDYPEKNPYNSRPIYFRKAFELNGAEIMSGKLYSSSVNGGSIVYVNDNNVRAEDITQYLKIGKNVIAAEVNGWSFQILANIRTLSNPITSTSVMPTLAITPTPIRTTPLPDITTPEPPAAPLPEITKGQGASTASVSLTGEKTDVTLGEDIKLRLSAVNLINNPIMHVQVIILVPSGMSVTSSDFAKSGTNQFTAEYSLEPGDNKDVEVTIRPNQAGDFEVEGRIVYYFDDDKANTNDHTKILSITVRKSDPTPTPIQTAPPAPPSTKGIPGFNVLEAMLGVLFVTQLSRKIIRRK